MRSFALPPAFILLSSMAIFTPLLVACGSESGNPLMPTPAAPQKPPPINPAKEAEKPINPAKEAEKPAASIELSKDELKSSEPITHIPLTQLLANTEILPKLPLNNHPSNLIGDTEALTELKKGVYSTQITHLFTPGEEKLDCPKRSSLVCPSISYYRMDRDGKIQIKTWSYLPKSRRWIEIKGVKSIFDQVFNSGILFSDGNQWSNLVFNLSQSALQITENRVIYGIGKSEISLVGNMGSVQQSSAAEMSGVGYSTQAKVMSYRLGVTKGDYISLDQPTAVQKTDDVKDYPSLAKFRDIHSQKKSFLCFSAAGIAKGIVFNQNQLGAQLYQLKGTCENKVDESVPEINLEEGVKTIDGRQVIYLGQDTRSTSQSSHSSELQFFWAFAITDKGIATQGKAYPKGFIKDVAPQFYNEVAVLDWLKAKYGYSTHLPLPK